METEACYHPSFGMTHPLFAGIWGQVIWSKTDHFSLAKTARLLTIFGSMASARTPTGGNVGKRVKHWLEANLLPEKARMMLAYYHACTNQARIMPGIVSQEIAATACHAMLRKMLAPDGTFEQATGLPQPSQRLLDLSDRLVPDLPIPSDDAFQCMEDIVEGKYRKPSALDLQTAHTSGTRDKDPVLEKIRAEVDELVKAGTIPPAIDYRDEVAWAMRHLAPHVTIDPLEVPSVQALALVECARYDDAMARRVQETYLENAKAQIRQKQEAEERAKAERRAQANDADKAKASLAFMKIVPKEMFSNAPA